MKAIYLSLLASVMLTSCLGDVRIPENSKPDEKAITEEIRGELKDQLSDISITDTIYSEYVSQDTIIADGDTIIKANATSKLPSQVATYKVDMPDINVVIDQYDGLENMQRSRQKTLIAILGIVAPCATIAILAIVLGVFLYKRMRSRHGLIEKAIECNYQLPDAFYDTNATPKEDNQNGGVGNIPPLPAEVRMRDSGLKIGLTGIGIIIIFLVWGTEELAVIGVIPLLIGLGKLLTYYKIVK